MPGRSSLGTVAQAGTSTDTGMCIVTGVGVVVVPHVMCVLLITWVPGVPGCQKGFWCRVHVYPGTRVPGINTGYPPPLSAWCTRVPPGSVVRRFAEYLGRVPGVPPLLVARAMLVERFA
eukprot:2123136-Rhodomonas_salina.2